jgi:hypothetical protein
MYIPESAYLYISDCISLLNRYTYNFFVLLMRRISRQQAHENRSGDSFTTINHLLQQDLVHHRFPNASRFAQFRNRRLSTIFTVLHRRVCCAVTSPRLKELVLIIPGSFHCKISNFPSCRNPSIQHCRVAAACHEADIVDHGSYRWTYHLSSDTSCMHIFTDTCTITYIKIHAHI